MIPESNRQLGTIQNNDSNNILFSGSGPDLTPEEYCRDVEHLLEGRPGVLAQDVGMPDPVIYPSQVATTFDKYLVEVSMKTWPKDDPERTRDVHVHQVEGLRNLFAAGTDPLTLTIEVCRRHGVPVLASYRMNSGDWYQYTPELSDFGREHPEWLIPDKWTASLDYAVPEVFEQRLRIFAEVVDNFDIDGIELDFRRHYWFVSEPERNWPVLTELVRRTRRLLDDAARRKGRGRMLLGVRVDPILRGTFQAEHFPGVFLVQGCQHNEMSCQQRGTDVAGWVDEELVDYVCPTLFLASLPGLPRTAEFVELAAQRNVGVYPTLWSRPEWAQEERAMSQISRDEIVQLMSRHRDELCDAAEQAYADGADGISTFNWYGHLMYCARVSQWMEGSPPQYWDSLPCRKVELAAHAHLARDDIRAFRDCDMAELLATLGPPA